MVFGFPISVQLHPIQQHQAQASQALSILCWILKLRIQLLFIPVVGHGIDTSLNGDGAEENAKDINKGLRCTDSEMYWYVQWLVIYVYNCICSIYIYYYIIYTCHLWFTNDMTLSFYCWNIWNHQRSAPGARPTAKVKPPQWRFDLSRWTAANQWLDDAHGEIPLFWEWKAQHLSWKHEGTDWNGI